MTGGRRRRARHPARPAAASAPGTLILAHDAAPTRIAAMRLGPNGVAESAHASAADLPPRGEGMLWIDIQGLGDLTVTREIGARFSLHPLALADIVHTHQRPKTEVYDGFTLVVLRMPTGGPPFASEQISLVLANGVLLTFQERHGDWFDPVRARLRQAGPRFVAGGAGYLRSKVVIYFQPFCSLVKMDQGFMSGC
jgi:magnesium transporter